MMRQLETDILIIGGGAAGARAAIEASDGGCRVTMIVKGLLGRSGCSIFAGNLNWFGQPEDEDTAEQDAETKLNRTIAFQANYTHYLGDQEYMKKASQYSFENFFPWLEERGLYILRKDDGEFVVDLPRATSAWGTKMGMSGQIIMDLMRKEIFRRPIQVFEETSATKLLMRDGTAVGAVALDYLRGEIVLVHSKAVILATGHSNYLSLRSTGTREGSASGWVLAYRAGCELKNIEMQWYHTSDMAAPRSWMRLHLYPNPQPATAHRTQLFNTNQELFFDGNFYPENPVPYIMQLKHLAKQVRGGHARLDGGYYTNYRHVEPEVLEKYIYQTKFIRKVGLDPTKDLIENAVTWHMNVGGVKVDGQTMESRCPGLFIAGSVGALVTGGIANVTYDGWLAAQSAMNWVKRATSPPSMDDEANSECERLTLLLCTEPADGFSPAQIKKQIRTVMWEEMNYFKTEAAMQAALDRLRRIRNESVPKMRLGSTTRRFNYEWLEATEVHDMLEACELLIRFSLHRKESRGGFFREDYPATDNANWLRHVVGESSNGDLTLREESVDLPYVQPSETRADFFAVDY